jgi:ribosomal-protein-alanine N-acetyltransferase
MATQELRVMMNVKMRYFTPSDMVDVVDISRRASRNPWREQDFRIVLSTRNVACQVAVRGHRILGYVVYQAHKDSVQIMDVAVHPDFQRHRVGAQIFNLINRKLHPNRRKFAFLEVSERDLGVHLFLRSQGYKATAVHRNHFGSGDDCYVFEKGVDGAACEPELAVNYKEAARG